MFVGARFTFNWTKIVNSQRTLPQFVYKTKIKTLIYNMAFVKFKT